MQGNKGILQALQADLKVKAGVLLDQLDQGLVGAVQKRDHDLDFFSVISSFEDQVFNVLTLALTAQGHLIGLLLVVQEHLLEKVALFRIIIHVDLQTIALLHSKFVRSVQGCNRTIFYYAYL
jgi:hypothetical protein